MTDTIIVAIISGVFNVIAVTITALLTYKKAKENTDNNTNTIDTSIADIKTDIAVLYVKLENTENKVEDIIDTVDNIEDKVVSMQENSKSIDVIKRHLSITDKKLARVEIIASEITDKKSRK